MHTSVYPVRNISHNPIEFQIRTELMHREAEYGVAAHWQYKQNTREITESDQRKTLWMQGLVKQHLGMSSDTFIRLLHRQVYEDATTVFGKAGQIMRVPENATVSDYLKKANLTTPAGAVFLVNGKPVAADHILRDGDSIDIIEPEKEGAPGDDMSHSGTPLPGRSPPGTAPKQQERRKTSNIATV